MAVFTDDDIQQIRAIVRQETDDMRRDTSDLKGDTSNLKKDMTDIKQALTRNNILMEDLDNNVRILAEVVSRRLKLKDQVKDHSIQIDPLEADGKMTK